MANSTAAHATLVNYALERNNITTITTTTTAATATTASTAAASLATNEIKWHNVSSLLTKDNTRAFITAIRANVTAVLNLYFQNTTPTTTTTTTTDATTATPNTTTTTASTQNRNHQQHQQLHNQYIHQATATTTTATIRPTVRMPTSVLNTLASNATRHYVDEQQMLNNQSHSSSSSGSIGTDSLMMNTNDATAINTLTQLSMATERVTATATVTSNPNTIISNTTTAIMTAINGGGGGDGGAGAGVGGNMTDGSSLPQSMPSITFLSYPISVHNYDNCSTLFADYVYPPIADAGGATTTVKDAGTFCNWTWDGFLCWPKTPAGVLAKMRCPSGWITVDTRKFANRKCELNGHWGAKPNDTNNTHGWTDFRPCFKPEDYELMQSVPNSIFEIARHTRTLEMIGLIISLLALILSLIIFCNFRSLRNNRTKIHKNLFIAMILQVNVRLTLYLDQAIRRNGQMPATNVHGIENTPYVCETLYILLEYAKTAMFMWMWIEGFYLHNMVATLAVFHGGFPHRIFAIIGWFIPFVITLIWAICMAVYMDTWANYNLNNYYWILEGPRSLVIILNFFFLINIIRVLIVKLRESQASDVEQTRKAVKAAIVLLPLLGITNLLYLLPTSNTPWKFALWSYITHFLTSFQGFFIALIYCFLNGEVRAVLMKSLAVYMSVRGHPEWVPKQGSMYSAAYNTAPDTEAAAAGGQHDSRRYADCENNMPPKHRRSSSIHHNTVKCGKSKAKKNHNNNRTENRSNCLLTLCFRGQKVLRPPANSDVPPESVVFELSEQ